MDYSRSSSKLSVKNTVNRVSLSILVCFSKEVITINENLQGNIHVFVLSCLKFT